ncbi:mitochondrial 54S ribosomal protein mL54 [Apiospora aurea]|uniref:Large ribosomal subunit protein mL54 n=1 Tax=Apiospora aurea TaxID=335848 RepID=A0ABR1QBD1_9PEZI
MRYSHTRDKSDRVHHDLPALPPTRLVGAKPPRGILRRPPDHHHPSLPVPQPAGPLNITAAVRRPGRTADRDAHLQHAPGRRPGLLRRSGRGPLSACPAGTVLTGLNYFKNQTDPVALADDKYPEWLWRCLDVQKKTDDATADDAADEFSKSKKQRRLAAKRQRALEARLMAEGNLEALAPKIPLQQQSINMPGNEDGTAEGAVAAAAAREELRKAMRKERKAKIKESNYLKSM